MYINFHKYIYLYINIYLYIHILYIYIYAPVFSAMAPPGVQYTPGVRVKPMMIHTFQNGFHRITHKGTSVIKMFDKDHG
jgi:hypothetical protein